jgi:hypothetical protein
MPTVANSSPDSPRGNRPDRLQVLIRVAQAITAVSAAIVALRQLF